MYKMTFNETDVNGRFNYYRNYKLVSENILDVIKTYGDEKLGGITSEEITNYIGIRPSTIRRNLAKLINRVNTKKYFYRERSGSFKYFKTSNFDPVKAYDDIKNSEIDKVTLNQIGLKDSICFDTLIKKGETCPNVLNQLKKSKPNWISICEISEILGVNHRRGKSTISGELNRCMSCSVKFIECMFIDNVKKYRLVYKYWKHTIDDLMEIARVSFPKDKVHKISSGKIQALNNISSMKGI